MSDALRRSPPARPFCQPLIVKTAVGLALCMALAVQAQQAASTAPPPGMVMGAYGQSWQTTVAAPAVAASSNAAATATAATSSDPVSRFLQERGVLAHAHSGSTKLLNHVRDGASDMVLSAMNFLGVRYTRGGNSV